MFIYLFIFKTFVDMKTFCLVYKSASISIQNFEFLVILEFEKKFNQTISKNLTRNNYI